MRILAIPPAILLLLGLSSSAKALPQGIAAEGCSGCHQTAGITGALQISFSPNSFEPGDLVTVTVSVESTSAAVAGMYITTRDTGTLETVSGGGLKTVSSGLVHDGPRDVNDDSAQFRFAFRAPDEAGGVRFSAFALLANGNGQRSGDTAVETAVSKVFGCEGAEYYYDRDEDGYGAMLASPILACKGAPPEGTTQSTDDCNDYEETIHPGAVEACDKVDNDCNGQIDENSQPVELWPDADGDGHYSEAEKEGEPALGCVGLSGYAAEGGDCKPDDPTIYEGAEETCNYVDEDCDGQVDERARPICGEGWCRRESAGCDGQFCTPGEPSAEVCNYVDDDCDGLTDEGSLCESGLCSQGSCITGGEALDGGAPGEGPGQVDTEPGADSPDADAAASASGCALAWSHRARPDRAAWLVPMAGLWRRRRRR